MGKKRLALLFTIFLALISSGIVVAHLCHAAPINSQATQTYNQTQMHLSGASSPHAPSTNSGNTGKMIDSGCVALFIVVLLLGRKQLLDKGIGNCFKGYISWLPEIFYEYRPQARRLTPFLLQLGVIRI